MSRSWPAITFIGGVPWGLARYSSTSSSVPVWLSSQLFSFEYSESLLKRSGFAVRTLFISSGFSLDVESQALSDCIEGANSHGSTVMLAGADTISSLDFEFSSFALFSRSNAAFTRSSSWYCIMASALALSKGSFMTLENSTLYFLVIISYGLIPNSFAFTDRSAPYLTRSLSIGLRISSAAIRAAVPLDLHTWFGSAPASSRLNTQSK
mmetsp:Transcript_3067/g.7159  ORF Transcript_3067/g.7159 Transcript_3067/m.7159 type:complete len:209 (-) Transcript_3067:701-1327(-)